MANYRESTQFNHWLFDGVPEMDRIFKLNMEKFDNKVKEMIIFNSKHD